MKVAAREGSARAREGGRRAACPAAAAERSSARALGGWGARTDGDEGAQRASAQAADAVAGGAAVAEARAGADCEAGEREAQGRREGGLRQRRGVGHRVEGGAGAQACDEERAPRGLRVQGRAAGEEAVEGAADAGDAAVRELRAWEDII